MLENASERNSAVDSIKNGGKSVSRGNGAENNAVAKSYVPPDPDSVDIFKLLDQLEEFPDKCTHLPFNVLLGFDKEQFHYLVLKVRANLPDDMKKAKRVARESERIVVQARDAAVHQLESGREEAQRLVEQAKAEAAKAQEDNRTWIARVTEEAHAEAARITETARERASQMVEQCEIHRTATAQAHDLIRKAETEANEIRKGADDYARDVLANLETVMGKAIATIQRGRETLDKART